MSVATCSPVFAIYLQGRKEDLMTQHDRSISFQPEQDKNMPAWERKMREAGLTPFWDHVDDPLTELLTRASRVRVTGVEEESTFPSDDE